MSKYTGDYPRDCYPIRGLKGEPLGVFENPHLAAVAKIVEGVRDGERVVYVKPPGVHHGPIIFVPPPVPKASFSGRSAKGRARRT